MLGELFKLNVIFQISTNITMFLPLLEEIK